MPSTPSNADRFARPVVCAWCRNRHRSITGDANNTQGDGCAASVFERGGRWLVRGHYGSTSHDMCTYMFVANAPTERADPVCDNCIGERLTVGDLISLDLTHHTS